MMMRLLGLTAVLVLCCSAWAQSGSMPSFEDLDANRDGRISVSEARKDRRVAARFAAADANQDGYLDRAEFAAIRG